MENPAQNVRRKAGKDNNILYWLTDWLGDWVGRREEMHMDVKKLNELDLYETSKVMSDKSILDRKK